MTRENFIPGNIYELFGTDYQSLHLYIYLLINAAKEDGSSMNVGIKEVPVNTGQVAISQQEVGDRIGYHRKQIKRALNRLVKKSLAIIETICGVTVVSVVYEKDENNKKCPSKKGGKWPSGKCPSKFEADGNIKCPSKNIENRPKEKSVFGHEVYKSKLKSVHQKRGGSGQVVSVHQNSRLTETSSVHQKMGQSVHQVKKNGSYSKPPNTPPLSLYASTTTTPYSPPPPRQVNGTSPGGGGLLKFFKTPEEQQKFLDEYLQLEKAKRKRANKKLGPIYHKNRFLRKKIRDFQQDAQEFEEAKREVFAAREEKLRQHGNNVMIRFNDCIDLFLSPTAYKHKLNWNKIFERIKSGSEKTLLISFRELVDDELLIKHMAANYIGIIADQNGIEYNPVDLYEVFEGNSPDGMEVFFKGVLDVLNGPESRN